MSLSLHQYHASPVLPRLGAVVVALLAISACTKEDATPMDTTTAVAPAPAAPAAPGAQGVNDAQIAHIVVTANAIDSSFGVLARQKGASQGVKDFAQTMITDHGNVNRQAVDLAQRLNVTPEANATSTQLQQAADSARTAMEGLSGAAFDSAYIAREVAYHQAVLDALDNTLIPGAQNADLKKLLQDTRPAFVAHLDRAKQVQGALGKP
jgi:putative membrane protein